MHKKTDIDILEEPETSKFVVYYQSSTAQYVNYINDGSLIPSSFDQIMKNNIIIAPVE